MRVKLFHKRLPELEEEFVIITVARVFSIFENNNAGLNIINFTAAYQFLNTQRKHHE
jgi:hypothetical protein